MSHGPEDPQPRGFGPGCQLGASVPAAAEYADKALRKCCEDGMKENPMGHSCERRTSYIQEGEACVRAFLDCCTYIKGIRDKYQRQFYLEQARSKCWGTAGWRWEGVGRAWGNLKPSLGEGQTVLRLCLHCPWARLGWVLGDAGMSFGHGWVDAYKLLGQDKGGAWVMLGSTQGLWP